MIIQVLGEILHNLQHLNIEIHHNQVEILLIIVITINITDITIMDGITHHTTTGTTHTGLETEVKFTSMKMVSQIQLEQHQQDSQ
jgi:hypothetical protein